MRTAMVCLLSLAFAAAADAAPAPLPRGRDPGPSAEQVEQFLRDRFVASVESIQARGKREWVVVISSPDYYWSTRRGGDRRRRVLLVKCLGKDEEGRPQFSAAVLSSERYR